MKIDELVDKGYGIREEDRKKYPKVEVRSPEDRGRRATMVKLKSDIVYYPKGGFLEKYCL